MSYEFDRWYVEFNHPDGGGTFTEEFRFWKDAREYAQALFKDGTMVTIGHGCKVPVSFTDPKEIKVWRLQQEYWKWQ
jgi:hypothetical protein